MKLITPFSPGLGPPWCPPCGPVMLWSVMCQDVWSSKIRQDKITNNPKCRHHVMVNEDTDKTVRANNNNNNQSDVRPVRALCHLCTHI